MAFSRTATAMVVQPLITQKGWAKVRKASVTPARSLVTQASEILGENFDPKRYLLSHATIVCSVDVEPVPNVKLGKIKIGSSTINRKWADYRITPETEPQINSNFDAWSREVILASYHTFIGASNYQEHLQIEEAVKGKVIDAIARDIGPSIYVDILIATDRKHDQLVRDIESGKMSTLSMGCSVEYCQCTKCGNVAADETELCSCIKYSKGNRFFGEDGIQHKIAELCGHPSLDNAGVNFIDASWVATPAFKGAVLRNIIEPANLPESVAKHAQEVLSSLPKEWDHNAQQHTASLTTQAADEQVWDDTETEPDLGEGSQTPSEPAKSPAKDENLDKLVDDVYKAVRDRVKDRADQDLKEKPSGLNPENSSMHPNESIRKEAFQKAARHAYTGTVNTLLRTATSDAAFVDGLFSINDSFGIHMGRDVYRASLTVGPFENTTMDRYVKACQQALGRSLSPAEVRVMVRIGKLLTRLGSQLPAPSQER